jgi:hypothetical protein
MMEAFIEPLYICSNDLVIEYMNPAMTRRIGSLESEHLPINRL